MEEKAMERRYLSSLGQTFALILMVVILPACIVVGMTEHRVEFRADGAGKAWLRLTDIRSDGVTDSSAERDFNIMMDSFEKEGIGDFEKGGRKVTNKRFIVHGDTLSAEIEYTFMSKADIEGLNVTEQEMYVVIPENRDVVWTNGRVSPWERGTMRIVWDLDEGSLVYHVREKHLPSSISLAPLYLAQKSQSGGTSD
jgi:hypothetical protein